jgi:hypothetical protein
MGAVFLVDPDIEPGALHTASPQCGRDFLFQLNTKCGIIVAAEAPNKKNSIFSVSPAIRECSLGR